MKTTFTRREIVHTGIKKIRSFMSIYQETKTIVFVNTADDIVSALETLKIINLERKKLLSHIVTNEFKRILNNGKGEWRK